MVLPTEEIMLSEPKMEYDEELEDLVVLLDMDKDKYSDEYEVLEDLITIEDEGIMDISYKLQQRDFDEYVSSLRKDTAILPKSFCRINQNIRLLDRCRPLTIQVIDCKKFKIFYNDKLAVDLKTRENYNDKFKEILSDKDNDISDDDTIELEVDIGDEAEMEDLIKYNDNQENERGNEKIKFLTNEDSGIPKMKEVNSITFNETSHVNLDHDNSFLIDVPKVCNQTDFIDYRKKSTKKENTTKHNISKSSKQTKNKDRSLDKSEYSTKKKNKKINSHTKSIQLNIEMQKKIADMLVKVEELKTNYSKKSSKKSMNFSNNAGTLNNLKVYYNQTNNMNLIPSHATRPQMYEWQQNYINMRPMATMQVGSSIFYHSNPIVNSPYAQQPYYYSNINNAFIQSSQFSSNNNLHCVNNNSLQNFPIAKITPNNTISRSLSSINFMKPHLQKLAKANVNPRSIKIRPIHNYGLADNLKQQEHGKATLSNTNSLRNNHREKITTNKIMDVKNVVCESNLNDNSGVINNHPTVVRILQNGIVQDNKQVNDVPKPKINNNLEAGTLRPNKSSVASKIFRPDEIHEFRRRMLLYENNQLPQQIPTLQNRQVVEPLQTSSKTQNSPEYANHESAAQNVTVPCRIPVIKKICKETQQFPQNMSELWRIPVIQKVDKETQKLVPQSVKINTERNKTSPKYDKKFEQHTQKIIGEPIKEEDVKKETKSVRDEKLRTMPSLKFVKLPAQDQSPKHTLISPYQSPVQCVKVETHQSSPKIVKKLKREEDSKIEVKKKEANVKPTLLTKVTEPNPPKTIAKKAENSQKPVHRSPSAGSLSKVSKEYSPPVLPIPTFKKTFEMLAKVNLISKYKYRRNRHIFKYAIFDQDTILLNRSITKDLQK